MVGWWDDGMAGLLEGRVVEWWNSWLVVAIVGAT